MVKKSKVSRRDFMVAMAASSLLTSAQATRKKTKQGTTQPNIVLLLADDQRNDTLGCAGHPIVQTPNIDALAAQGCHFKNAYVTTSICAASRASIFTGLYERTHEYTFLTPPLQQAYIDNSYPVKLRENGYKTSFVGKLGVNMPSSAIDQMFDDFLRLPPRMYFYEQPDGSMRHETDVAIDHAINFIQQNQASPFVVSVSFNAPHADPTHLENHYPWPESSNGLYENITIPEPLLSDETIFEALPTFLKESINHDRYFWRWDTPEKYQRNMKGYFRMITGVDTAIGRLIAELKNLNLDQNTVIIYMADNGYYMGNRGFAGKWSHYEESMRIPLIVYDPRVTPQNQGKVAEEISLNVDIASTILDIANVTVPSTYQGLSVAPILNGEVGFAWRKDFFGEHLMDRLDIPKWEGVRTDQYIYAKYFEQQPAYEFLHDLSIDPDQLINFADNPSYSEKLEEMRSRTNTLKQNYINSRNVIFKQGFE